MPLITQPREIYVMLERGLVRYRVPLCIERPFTSHLNSIEFKFSEHLLLHGRMSHPEKIELDITKILGDALEAAKVVRPKLPESTGRFERDPCVMC